MPSRRKSAFTLVELLVVIGIIALLLGILLPALASARQHANLVKCLSNQRAIVLAATLQTHDHAGYMQAAGIFSGIAATPAGMNDAYQTRYRYYADGTALRPVPFFTACAQEMGVKIDGTSRATLQAGINRAMTGTVFQCPSVVNPLAGVTEGDNLGYLGPTEPISYVLNEEMLGFRDWRSDTPHGKLARARRSEVVMLFADGRPRVIYQPIYTIYAVNADSTLADYAEIDRLVGYKTMDFIRHKGLVNVAFCDGHAETVSMGKPDRTSVGQISRVGVTRGIYQ